MEHQIRSACLPLLSTPLLAACVSSNGERPSAPSTEARVRVYWGAVVHFHFDTPCVPREGLLGYSVNGMLASKPGLTSLANKTVGMPVPPDAARYCHEYIVAADRPLAVSARISRRILRGATTYIETPPRGAGTFTPKPGQDDEVFAEGDVGPARIRVRQLHEDANGISTSPVTVAAAPPCP
ncbi:hypothetical protein [Burkholderia sp. ABCPW 14]|uniref:hypothetical protein n=1 Tax=Burkholderia sp. ABCPW 14 TaxID=1637860 RepID=UPI0012E38D26|nr:hypothetical protein [Burkholderia sp. ABCPW 14]